MEYLDKEGLRYYNSKIQTQINAKANDGDLSAVAKSGSYNDLTNKPSIPPEITVDSALSTTSTNPVQNNLVTNALNSKVSSSNVVDNLTSVGANVPLSAKQGKILNESKLEASNIKAGENIVLSKSGNDITISSTGGGGGGSSVAVIDNLNSSSAVSALSANQGRVLDGKITDVADTVDTNSDDIDSLESDVTTLQTNVTNMTADIASLTGSLDDKLDASNILAGTNIAINTDANNNVTISSSASSVSKYSLTELKALTDPTDDLFLSLKADIINHNPMVITYNKNLNSSTSISAEAVVLSATVETVQNFGEVYIISFRKDIISHPGIIHTIGFIPQGEQLVVSEILMIENEVVTEEPQYIYNLTLDSLEPGDIVGCVSNMEIRYSESDEWSTLEGTNTGDIFIKNAPRGSSDPVGYIAAKMRDNWYMVYAAVYHNSSGFFVSEFTSNGRFPINPIYLLEKVVVRKDRLIAGTNVSINEDSSGFITISAAGGSGGSVVVDSALSSTSENPVQNKVINSALNNKADASDIPTKVSDLTNDSGFISSYTETDPVFSASAAHGITSSDISSWNNKSDFSGSYNDLTDKPIIPSQITVDSTLSSSSTNPVQNKVINTALEEKLNANRYYIQDILDITSVSDALAREIMNNIGDANPIIVYDYDDSPAGEVVECVPTAIVGAEGFWLYYCTNSNYVVVSAVIGSGNAMTVTRNTFPSIDTLSNYIGNLNNLTTSDKTSLVNAINELKASEFSGSYTDLTDKPTIPSKTSDLTNDSDFVTKTSYASNQNGGVIKTDTSTYGTSMYSGYLTGSTRTYSQYNSAANALFVSKGTLENVITGKGLATSSDIPTKVSDLTNDSGFITSYTETDPVFSASAASGITSSDISSWNNKSTFSGDYDDLTNKPTIPTATSDLTNDSGFITSSYHDSSKQDVLVSGTNIKTINGNSVLGNGDISLAGAETLPVGSEIYYDGSTVPTGWEEMTDYDSGWIEITPTIGTAGTGYYVPMYRKIGNVVYLRGQITGVTQRTTEMFALPSNFYNTSARMTFCTTNDTLEINFVRVLNTGIVQLQRTTGTLGNGITVYLDGICFTVD